MFKSLLSMLLLVTQVLVPTYLTTETDTSSAYASAVHISDEYQTITPIDSNRNLPGANMPDGSFSPCGPLIGGTIGGSHISSGGIGCPPIPAEIIEPPTIEIGVTPTSQTRNSAETTSIEVGTRLRYEILVTNSNNFAIRNYLVVSALDLSLVDFIPGSVRINNRLATSNEHMFSQETGELFIALSELSANSTYVLNFEVTVLSGNKNNLILQNARLYDVNLTNQTTTFIGEAITSVVISEPDPCATEPDPCATEPDPCATEPTQPSTPPPTDPCPTDPADPCATEPPRPSTPPATEPTQPSTPPATEPTRPSTPPTLAPPNIEIEVEPVQQPALHRAQFNEETNVAIGGTLRYGISLENPNDVAIHNFLVHNALDLDLVDFVPGSVTVNGTPVAPTHYLFNPATGELFIIMPELAANTTYSIQFKAVALAGDDNDVIPLTARLYGDFRPNGTPTFISEVEATVNVVTETPTTPPTAAPTEAPTTSPTEAPTEEAPTTSPTEAPTEEAPTTPPTEAPTEEASTTPPTEAPTEEASTTPPTAAPTEAPTTSPTEAPTATPTAPPTGGGVNLPQTGAVASFALAASGTSFIGAGSILLVKAKKK